MLPRSPHRLLRQRIRAGLLRRSALWCGALVACAALPCAGRAQVDAPSPSSSAQPERSASLHGSVTDQEGSLLPGARVEVTCQEDSFVEIADSEGEFHVNGLAAGVYTLRVLDDGFATVDESVTLLDGESKELTPIELHMAVSRADVVVVASPHEVATAQLAAEEKQRVLAIIPNFYVVYDPHPAPLSAGQKFHLAWRSSFDPVSFLSAGFSAGIEQSSNEFSGYGEGAGGYAKRFGASFADGAVATFLGGAILPVIFRQDPRYYYQGTGTVKSRTLHAIASVVVAHGNNGKLQFNYSNVIGTFASAALSNVYYPASNRDGVGLTMGNAAQGLGFDAFAAIMQEFVVRKLTPHLPSLHKGPIAP